MYIISLGQGHAYDTIKFVSQCKQKLVPGTVWVDADRLRLVLGDDKSYHCLPRVLHPDDEWTLIGALLSPRTVSMMMSIMLQWYCSFARVYALYRLPSTAEDIVAWCDANTYPKSERLPKKLTDVAHLVYQNGQFVSSAHQSGQQLIVFPTLRTMTQMLGHGFHHPSIAMADAKMTKKTYHTIHDRLVSKKAPVLVSTSSTFFFDRRWLRSVVLVYPRHSAYTRQRAPRCWIPDVAREMAELYGATYEEID